MDKSWTTNILGCLLCFTNNHAEKGGGLYLDKNTKIYLYTDNYFRSSIHLFAFISNLANYGGGIYISDNPCYSLCGLTYNSQYATNRLSDLCFIQVPETPNITVDIFFFKIIML